MEGQISSSKGTLLECFVQFVNGKILSIQPLYDNAGIILFKQNAINDLKDNFTIGDETIGVIDNNGKLTAKYEIESKIERIENTVIYPDGQIWTGPILEGQENDINYFILTEEALKFFKDENLTFSNDNLDKRPTILVRFDNRSVQGACGNHTCGRCFKFDKFLRNGLS